MLSEAELLKKLSDLRWRAKRPADYDADPVVELSHRVAALEEVMDFVLQYLVALWVEKAREAKR